MWYGVCMYVCACACVCRCACDGSLCHDQRLHSLPPPPAVACCIDHTINTHTHTHVHTHAYARTHTRSHTRIRAHTYTCAHIRPHARAHTHAHTQHHVVIDIDGTVLLNYDSPTKDYMRCVWWWFKFKFKFNPYIPFRLYHQQSVPSDYLTPTVKF